MDPEKLVAHAGHTLEVVTYGKPVENVTIECTDCYAVIIDLDMASGKEFIESIEEEVLSAPRKVPSLLAATAKEISIKSNRRLDLELLEAVQLQDIDHIHHLVITWSPNNMDRCVASWLNPYSSNDV